MRRNCCRKHLRRDLIILQQEIQQEVWKKLDAILTFYLYLDQIGWRSPLRVLCHTAVAPFINPWGSQKINDVQTEKAFLPRHIMCHFGTREILYKIVERSNFLTSLKCFVTRGLCRTPGVRRTSPASLQSPFKSFYQFSIFILKKFWAKLPS